jgi:hypothetical protein
MNLFDLLLILVIGYIIYWIVKGYKNNNEYFSQVPKQKKKKVRFTKETDDDDFSLEHLDNIISEKSKKSKQINPYFVEMQFHNDFRDTITAFNNICPGQKPIFNQANVPTRAGKPNDKLVKEIVNDFIREVNANIGDIDDFRTKNSGWDELMPDKKVKSGWDKQQEELGLPANIYNEPAKKSKVKLINIEKVEKYETNDETKYVCYFVLEKKNVSDQMIARVSFIINKHSVNEERKFFDKKQNEKPTITIEEIFVIGFMTFEGAGGKSDTSNRDDFYNFNQLEKSDMIDQKEISKQLIDKYNQRTVAMTNFTTALDEETAAIHRDLPDITKTKSYQQTKTIFDDDPELNFNNNQ